MSKPKLRIILADDQALFSESLKSVLESSDIFDVVGIALDGAQAVDLVKCSNPDIVVLDVRMPVMDGVEAAGIISRSNPDVKIVMLTTFPDDQYVHEALKCGAHGYLLKDISINYLVKSLESVAEGAVLLSSTVSGRMVAGPSRSEKEDLHSKLLNELTKREIEILRLIAQGYGNGEIEDKLNLSKQTIRNYISTIYSKIDAKDRFEAIRIGIESELLEKKHF